MASEQHLESGLDQDLKTRVTNNFIEEGRLFGSISQNQLTTDEIMALTRAGWSKLDYHDAPVMEAPHSTIDWWGLKRCHRDTTLHAISHRFSEGAPWIGTRQEILEELLASQWEKQEEELRTLLHAFAYASVWNQEGREEPTSIESQETFFFYTERMRDTALKATEHVTKAPDRNDLFWEMVTALTEVSD